MWELRTVGTESVSYVFGTMHAGSDEAYAHYRLAVKYLAKCSVFANEADLSDGISDTAHLYLNSGVTLSTLIPPKKYKKLNRVILKNTGLKLDDLNHFKPIILQNMIMETAFINNSRLPLDLHLKNVASNLLLTITGVETLDDQIQILNSIPIDQQLKSLLKSIRKMKASKQSFRKMIRLYKEADLHGLTKLSRKSLAGQRKLMLYDRNQKMAEWIFDTIQSERTFVAIGAAHLAGQKGVLNLLKKKGVTLSPVIE